MLMYFIPVYPTNSCKKQAHDFHSCLQWNGETVKPKNLVFQTESPLRLYRRDARLAPSEDENEDNG